MLLCYKTLTTTYINSATTIIPPTALPAIITILLLLLLPPAVVEVLPDAPPDDCDELTQAVEAVPCVVEPMEHIKQFPGPEAALN